MNTPDQIVVSNVSNFGFWPMLVYKLFRRVWNPIFESQPAALFCFLYFLKTYAEQRFTQEEIEKNLAECKNLSELLDHIQKLPKQ